MVIRSKYNGKCKACGARINKGTEIEWSKGSGARHVDCDSVDPVSMDRDGNLTAYQRGDRSRGARASHYDRHGVYGHDGHYMGSTCGCEDYPCCGH